MQMRFVLKCPGCGAPLADSVKRCPFCSKPTTFEALGMSGGLRKGPDGRLVIADGARVVLGATDGEQRQCPFCGAMADAAGKFCGHCGSKIVIETMWLRSLTITAGGSLHIGGGGSLQVGRPPEDPALTAAARRGDVDAIKAALDAGAEIDGCDDHRATALHHALRARKLDAARYLASMGATLDDEDDTGATPLALAAALGLAL